MLSPASCSPPVSKVCEIVSSCSEATSIFLDPAGTPQYSHQTPPCIRRMGDWLFEALRFFWFQGFITQTWTLLLWAAGLHYSQFLEDLEKQALRNMKAKVKPWGFLLFLAVWEVFWGNDGKENVKPCLKHWGKKCTNLFSSFISNEHSLFAFCSFHFLSLDETLTEEHQSQYLCSVCVAGLWWWILRAAVAEARLCTHPAGLRVTCMN